jgi:hypothetical protein
MSARWPGEYVGPVALGRNALTGSRTAPWVLLPVREPDVDLREAEAENQVRQEALLTLHELSESWWSGERRRPD